MAKLFAFALFAALVAVALAAPGQRAEEVQASAEGKTGDLQTANSFYGGYYGGGYPFYGGYYGHGFGGYPYGGFYGHGYGYGYPGYYYG